MEVTKSNIEEIFAYAHEHRKKIVWMAATMEDITRLLPQIVEFYKWLTDEWKTPDYLEKEETEFRGLTEYVDFLVCVELQDDQVIQVTIENEVFMVYSAKRLYNLQPSCNIIWLLISKAISQDVASIFADMQEIEGLRIFYNGEGYKRKTRGFFIQRIIEPYFFCMRNHLCMPQDEIEKEYGEIKKILSQGGVIIPNITFEVTTKCTLRCRHCADYNPWLTKYDADVNEIIDQTKKVLDAVDRLLYYQICTGESLLYPQLDKLLRYVIEEPRISRMLILTNGIVMPTPEIMELLKNKKIYIQMSDYNVPVQKEHFRLYRDAGVNIVFFEGQTWYSWGAKKIYSREHSVERLKEIYAGCRQGKSCPRQVVNGRLYNCGRALRYEQLGDCRSLRDSFDLRQIPDSKVMKEKLLDNYLIDYLEGCDYCDEQDEDIRIIPAGEQL